MNFNYLKLNTSIFPKQTSEYLILLRRIFLNDRRILPAEIIRNFIILFQWVRKKALLLLNKRKGQISRLQKKNQRKLKKKGLPSSIENIQEENMKFISQNFQDLKNIRLFRKS